MSDSPHEYIEKLKLENNMLRAALKRISEFAPSDNSEAIADCFAARRIAREALEPNT